MVARVTVDAALSHTRARAHARTQGGAWYKAEGGNFCVPVSEEGRRAIEAPASKAGSGAANLVRGFRVWGLGFRV